MSATIPMYIISNGDLAKEALNAVAALLGGDTFKTAMKIGVLFSIYGAVINYIRGHDFATFTKWFITYFSIATIMLGPKVTLQIIDSSNPGAGLTVANIPYGLGYPASIITSMSHGIIQSFEKVFHTPDDLSYNKTGMLFGSKLFRISSEFNVVNPVIKSELNEYVKNCVLGDILISKKYSMSDLTESTNILDTITQNTSNIRGIYISGLFKTCQEATKDIKTHLETDARDNIFKNLGKRIGIVNKESEKIGGSKKAGESAEAKRLLENAYHYFNCGNLSRTASEIAIQNVLINGVRDGLLNYTAETGATAALLNLSTAQAMDKMRMSLATSRNIALYTIPIIHTVLLILMLSLFPIIILLALQPSLTAQVLTNYLYTLLWIESWPLMFSCLNMMVTFYAKELGPGGLTISNIDKLLLEHSDIANMAGYLMLSIPFISGGLVKGMSTAFNHAASYIGGVLQSSASSAASEAASGNIHLGNSSWNNVNANKFDTNSTLMHGMATEQLGTGVLKTSRPDGAHIYDASHAISKLPTSVRSSELLNSALTEQAETSRTASIQDLKTYDQSMSHSVSDFSSLGKTLSSGKNMTESLGNREAISAGESFLDAKNIAENIAKNNNVEVDDVFKAMTNFSQSGKFSIGGSASFSIPINKVAKADGEASLVFGIGAEHVRSNESQARHGVNRSITVNAEDAQRFSKDLHKIEEYSKTSHADKTTSTAESQLSQLSTDLRSSRNSLEQYSVHKADAERKAHMASFVRQHSGQIDSDLGQEIAGYTVERKGREKAETLFAGKNRESRIELVNIAKEYISSSGIESSIMSQYQQDSTGIDPDKKYHTGAVEVDAKARDITLGHEQHKQKMDTNAKTKKLGVDEDKFEKTRTIVESEQKKTNGDLNKIAENQNNRYITLRKEVAQDIESGAEKAKHSVFTRGSIEPDFANSDKKKT